MATGRSFFDQVNRNFDKAAALTSHHPGLLGIIKTCNSVYHFTFPLRRMDGQRAAHPGEDHLRGRERSDHEPRQRAALGKGCADPARSLLQRGRRRFDEKAFSRLLGAVSSATGKQFSVDEHADITRGAEELDLVSSGLEETMSVAYHRLWEIRNQHKGTDLRTAAFLDAIDKIAVCYQDLGIFP